MGRTDAPLAKQAGSRKARKKPAEVSRPQQTPIPPATVRSLKALVQRHRNNDRIASWELGYLAGRVLKHTDMSPAPRVAIADLAEQIGLIEPPDPATSDKRRDESNLRQLMKFARLATQRQAQGLHKAKVAWRGIVYWLGVESDAQRAKLYEEMVSGLTNSTKIRNYIASRFKNPARPRSHPELSRNYLNAQATADTLVEMLKNLEGRLETQVADGKDVTKREKGGLEASQRHLDVAVKEAARLARATAAHVERLR